jgi:O-antigen/teichoic acid export membrane protein
VKAVRGRRAAMMDWLARGPFAIAASALQGGMNYFIVLFLTFTASLVATGEYRTLFSYYALLQLASMLESNKVFIRAVVAEDRHATTAIIVNRMAFGAATFAVLALLWLAGIVPGVVVAIAAITAIISPFDLYVGLFQARRRFQRLFVVEMVKYGAALASFVLLIELGRPIVEAVIVQLLVMGMCHLVYFTRYGAEWFDLGLVRRRGLGLLRETAPGQARLFSIGNMFPASLENIDKLLVGWVFGLHFLGIYTLAYSTGRFLYNTLKPAMYVYYRKFVDAMPPWPLMIRVSLAFTALGAVSAIIFIVLVAHVPALEKFEAGKWATVILFLGYGLGILSAIYSQAFSLNKDSVASDSLRANVLATAASLMVLGAALTMREPLALIFLALQYPIRDGLSTLLMATFRRRRSAPVG